MKFWIPLCLACSLSVCPTVAESGTRWPRNEDRVLVGLSYGYGQGVAEGDISVVSFNLDPKGTRLAARLFYFATEELAFGAEFTRWIDEDEIDQLELWLSGLTVTWFGMPRFFVRGGIGLGEVDGVFKLPTSDEPVEEEGLGLLVAIGFEVAAVGGAHLWLQADFWHLDTFEGVTANGRTASVTVNYALW